MQRLEVVVAELRRQSRCERKTKARRQGEMVNTPAPIYKGMDARHARESRRLKSSHGYLDASILGMFIKIKIN